MPFFFSRVEIPLLTILAHARAAEMLLDWQASVGVLQIVQMCNPDFRPTGAAAQAASNLTMGSLTFPVARAANATNASALGGNRTAQGFRSDYVDLLCEPGCAGLKRPSSSLEAAFEATEPSMSPLLLCLDRYTGPLCGVCATGYGRARLLECQVRPRDRHSTPRTDTATPPRTRPSLVSHPSRALTMLSSPTRNSSPQLCFNRRRNTAFYFLVVGANVISLILTIRTAIIRNSGNATPPLYSQIIKARGGWRSVTAVHASCLTGALPLLGIAVRATCSG